MATEPLRAARVIAYPTETVYGLAVDPFSETALDALFAVKQRDAGKPVLLIVADLAQVATLVGNLSDAAVRCIEQFWPGPLSLLLPAAQRLPKRLTDDAGHICVRCPGYAPARRLCRLWGGPLTSTSANLSGHPPARTPAAAALPGVALVLDGGALASQPPSTVFDPETGRVLREGPISRQMLQTAGVLQPTRNV